jgi:diadenosine tetraphosphate (Ap4A) HIT family hydrolase
MIASLTMPSVFSERPPSEHVAFNKLAFAIRDAYPVSSGHALVVPFREVVTWFDASADEKKAILDLIEIVKGQPDAEFRPQGYYVGFNAGAAAGQTVNHLVKSTIPGCCLNLAPRST